MRVPSQKSTIYFHFFGHCFSYHFAEKKNALILTINQHLKKVEECLIAGSEKQIIVILLDKVKYFFNHKDSKLYRYFIEKQTSFRCIGNRNLR